MNDDLVSARASFYRRFVVIGTAAVGHLAIIMSCLALLLIGKTMLGAVGLFVGGHIVLIPLSVGAWQRLKAEYPSTIPVAEAEARGNVKANAPYATGRTSAAGAFGLREARNTDPERLGASGRP
jgi:hypothetical protein